MSAADAASSGADDLHAELRSIAERQLRRESSSNAVQARALLEEAWRHLTERPVRIENRSSFLGVAARSMRQVLVDHARRERTARPAGDSSRVTLGTPAGAQAEEPSPETSADVLELDEALTRLEQSDPRLARLVELRYFAGMSIEEVAGALAASNQAVSSDWRRAQLWLARELAR